QARALVQERLGVAAGGEGSLLVLETTTDRWLEAGRFARGALGCVYFSFLSPVGWKEQGLGVVAPLGDLDAGVGGVMKVKLGGAGEGGGGGGGGGRRARSLWGGGRAAGGRGGNSSDLSAPGWGAPRPLPPFPPPRGGGAPPLPIPWGGPPPPPPYR